MTVTAESLAAKVLAWFDEYGRKSLPWQQQPTPYRVWVSEIMLQQTQVATVIPYYETFMQRFPTLLALADAPLDEVLKHWQGLGYYARARNLHKTAQIIRDQYQGEFPQTLAQVESLAGIGRSTAGAILSLALGQQHAILDGNVKRVLARYHAVQGWAGTPKIQQQLWQYAEQHVPDSRNADYTQAMMDMGATLCTRSNPLCLYCPLQDGCQAFKLGLQANIPAPKPSKVLPEKSAVIVLLQNAQGEYLLQRRPPTGIWGGLWSFPEFADIHQAQDWLQTQTDLALSPAQLEASWSHGFSHYTLHLQPYRLTMHTSPTRIMEAEQWLWYKAGTELAGGLSAAVRYWFQNIQSTEVTP